VRDLVTLKILKKLLLKVCLIVLALLEKQTFWCLYKPNMNRTGNRFNDRKSEKFKTYQGYEVEIIEYFNASNCTIIFNDIKKTIRKNVAIKELKSGSVKNYYHPEVLGIGYMGEGDYSARVDKKMTKCYRTWFNMLSRCYKDTNNRRTSYKGVSVCEEWHNFQNFAVWFYSNFNPETMQGWHIDKDILCLDCKVYSPETCCFLPNEINVIFKKNNESTHNLPKGVYPKDGKFQASISKFGKQCYLGFFDTIEEAHDVYNKAKKDYLEEVSIKWRGVLSDTICDAIRNFDISLL
jgi:hypothetical protein